MRVLPSFAALVCLAGSLSCPRVSAEPVSREIVVGGATRSYLLSVPAAWDRVRPLPVLFVFHGAGSDAESMVRATGFDALSETTPMLVVYPRAPERVKRYEVDPPAGRLSADVEFVDALLARLRERFPIDAQRIWATGFSNGAALCYRLAAERPQVIAAIAPVAGYLPDLSRTAAGVPVPLPVPLLHVHGSADGRVGAPTSAVATWARRNAATRGPVADVLPGTGALVVRRTAYTGATPRSDASLLLIEGEGHVWSGGPGGPISRAILEFLGTHPHDAARPAAAPAAPAPPTTRAQPAPRDAAQPLVGTPFGSTASLRWLTPEGAPVAFSAQRLTLLRWWTNACPHCVGSVPALAGLEARYRARGLRMVGVYHPKGARLSDTAARDYAARLGFSGALAFDDRWTKYLELRDRGGLRKATSITVLVDSEGIVRWVHPGPRIDPGSADLAALDAALDRMLPAAAHAGPPPAR